jgi:hypothetical protein
MPEDTPGEEQRTMLSFTEAADRLVEDGIAQSMTAEGLRRLARDPASGWPIGSKDYRVVGKTRLLPYELLAPYMQARRRGRGPDKTKQRSALTTRSDRASKQQGEPDMDMAEETPTISEPVPANDRGFLTYGGREIPTDYGHTIRVQESSSAEGPKVWLFISDSPVVEGHNPHLTLEQAIAVHAALGQFVEGVAARWEGGAEMVIEARRRVLGGPEE